jgi:ABC-type multidrug transport system ATPase subunit
VRAAVADDIVQGLPDGLDSAIDAQGRNLSGGQRQRVRLARALLADAEILLAVEPTSALDAHTEARVAQRLRTAREGRTTVVTTTSPLVLDHADTVVYLTEGKTAATGTHRELLATEPGYRALVARDAGEDGDEETRAGAVAAANPGAGARSRTGVEARAEPSVEAGAETGVGARSRTGVEAGAETGVEAGAQTDAVPRAQTDAVPRAQTDAGAGAQTGVEARAKAEPDVIARADATTPKAGAGAGAEAQAETETETETEESVEASAGTAEVAAEEAVR